MARPETPTITLDAEWETYARLSAGRLDVSGADVLERAHVTGDPDLASRVLESLAITP